MNGKRRSLAGCVLAVTRVLAAGSLDPAAAQRKPEGEMRWARRERLLARRNG